MTRVVRDEALGPTGFATTTAKVAQGQIAPFTARQGSDPGAKDVLVAEVDVVPPTRRIGLRARDAVLRFDDPAARDQAAKLLAAAIGPCAEGPTGLRDRRDDRWIRSNRRIWWCEAEAAPTVKALEEFLTRSPVRQAPLAVPGGNYLQVDAGWKQPVPRVAEPGRSIPPPITWLGPNRRWPTST